MTETDTYAAYAAGLKKALDVFVGAPNTPDTVQAALFAVRHFQATFLAEHGSFAALGEPRATNTAGNSLHVCAPICTREEKIKADRFAAQRDQLMEELKAKSALEDRAAARRYFKIDGPSLVVRALEALAKRGEIDRFVVGAAIEKYRLLDVTAGTTGSAGGES